MSLRDDRRAIAYNIGIFLGTLVIGAGLMIVLDDPQAMLIDYHAGMTDVKVADTGRGYVVDAWDAGPWLIMVLGLLQLLGAVAYKSGRGI